MRAVQGLLALVSFLSNPTQLEAWRPHCRPHYKRSEGRNREAMGQEWQGPGTRLQCRHPQKYQATCLQRRHPRKYQATCLQRRRPRKYQATCLPRRHPQVNQASQAPRDR